MATMTRDVRTDIQAEVDRFEAAFARHDASAVAELYSEGAGYILPEATL